MIEKLYNLQEVANTIGVDRRTIYTWLYDGRLKARKIGKLWRVTESDLKELIERGTNKPTPSEADNSQVPKQ